MRKLLKNILSDCLRPGELPKNPSVLYKRNEEVLKATTTRTSTTIRRRSFRVLFKRNHFILKTSLATQNAPGCPSISLLLFLSGLRYGTSDFLPPLTVSKWGPSGKISSYITKIYRACLQKCFPLPMHRLHQTDHQ